MSDLGSLPVAVIGAGPVGMAAAAHLVRRGLQPLIFERGSSVGASVAEWGHVRVFSPWSYDIDDAARALLAESGWDEPEGTDLPTGSEIVARYLVPLGELPSIKPHLRLGTEVISVARESFAKMSSIRRGDRPFVVRSRDAAGHAQKTLVRAVIDATGTWCRPNPMGVDGLPVDGETEAAELIAYGIPDVLGAEASTYAGQRVLVVGGGHSAANVLLALLRLRETSPSTTILWALRRSGAHQLLGQARADALPERGALGLAVERAMEARTIEVMAPFAADLVERNSSGLRVSGRLGSAAASVEVDRIIVCTGFRPNRELTSELQVALDPVMEAPPALAPLIDPNVHSCGTVPPHGVVELAHPEPDFYVVGSKSYGRAPTFLMATGYEQARSVVAEIAGDYIAARQVHLVLPETGVCSVSPAVGGLTSSGCCGGPAQQADACCGADEEAKAAGESGCGCGTGVPAGSPVRELA